jgi:DedD protein
VARNENRTSDARPESRPEARTETKPTPKPREAPAQPPQQQQRTDDGARALALLEGKSASGAAATSSASSSSSSTADAKGNFVLQIAAYTTQADAQGRRDKLHASGITNAFVQEANVGGKQQYRLRVGPFPSREAARAAQARLRSLGYDNGFIAAQ